MSKTDNIYKNMPENFYDDLAESLLASFNIEGVDAIEEIPHFLSILNKRGYTINVNTQKDVYFMRVFTNTHKRQVTHKEWQLINRIMFYNFRMLSDVQAFELMLKTYSKDVQVKKEARLITYNLENNLIDIRLMKVKW